MWTSINVLLTRVTISNYSSLGYRVNYFNLNYNVILTKHKNSGMIRSVVKNTYSLGVF